MKKWEKETIHDLDYVFRQIHVSKINILNKTKILPSFFSNTPENDKNLSCDWSKYSTPESIKELIGRQYRYNTTEFKNPNNFHIIKLKVGKIRTNVANQIVTHSPSQRIPEVIGSPNNRAHSCIIGDKTDEEIRLKLCDIAEWTIFKP